MGLVQVQCVHIYIYSIAPEQSEQKEAVNKAVGHLSCATHTSVSPIWLAPQLPGDSTCLDSSIL